MPKKSKEQLVEKARKLQRLAENAGNEAEAQAALLTLQRLMAQHDLDSNDIREEDEIVVEEVRVQVTKGDLETKANSWINDLCVVIADNFRCKSFYTYNSVTFVGLQKDVPLASAAMTAAVEVVRKLTRKNIKNYRKVLKSHYPWYDGGYDPDIEYEVTEARFQYRKGFVKGLRAAYQKQVADSAKGGEIILLSRHPAVRSYMDENYSLREGKSWAACANHELHEVGKQDGESFGAGNRLGEDISHERTS